MGVKEEQILAKLKLRAVEEIKTASLQILVGLFTGIQEGVTTVDEEFGAVENATNEPLVDPEKVKAWWTVAEKENYAEYVTDKETVQIAAGVTLAQLEEIKANALAAQKEQLASEPEKEEKPPIDQGEKDFV